MQYLLLLPFLFAILLIGVLIIGALNGLVGMVKKRD